MCCYIVSIYWLPCLSSMSSWVLQESFGKFLKMHVARAIRMTTDPLNQYHTQTLVCPPLNIGGGVKLSLTMPKWKLHEKSRDCRSMKCLAWKRKRWGGTKRRLRFTFFQFFFRTLSPTFFIYTTTTFITTTPFSDASTPLKDTDMGTLSI